MPVSSTVQGFRTGVLRKGGPQIAAKYRAILGSPFGTASSYPLSIILPGRNFLFYDHDLWGPVRKIPFKRGYTQCNMSFVIYQDWYERKFLEAWMNLMIPPSTSSSGGSSFAKLKQEKTSTGSNSGDGLIAQGISIAQQTASAASDFFRNLTLDGYPDAMEGLLSSQDDTAISANSYGEYANYSNVRQAGRIVIECLNSSTGKPNTTFTLYEAFPAQITPVALGSDGTGYPSFTVSFQFNYYTVN